MKTRPNSHRHASQVDSQARSRRRGSTLLIVIALTGMLALLGVMFFSFASQELENARNFNRAAAELDNPGTPARIYFNHALKQIIQGSEPNEKNSAIYGPRHSIIGNMLGHDSHPFNGQGVTVKHYIDTSNASNITFEPRVFLTDDPTTLAGPAATNNWWNDPQVLLEFNDSPAANYDQAVPNARIAAERNPVGLPSPDVDYTYPDINNVFLAYRGFTRDPSTGGLRLVIKPSYHRPEVLAAIETTVDEDTNGNGVLDSGEDSNGNGLLDIGDFNQDGAIALEGDVDGDSALLTVEDGDGNGVLGSMEDANGNGVLDVEDLNGSGSPEALILRDPHWAYNGWTKNRVMRPHPGHVSYVINADTRVSEPTTIRRFIDDDTTDPTDLAIIAGLPGGSGGFRFRVDLDSDGRFNEQGVWSRSRPVVEEDTGPGAFARNGILDPGEDLNGNGVLDTNIFEYEFDVDNDNDGQRDGILMDLDYKPEQRPSDGALYVPLFSATIYDADALFNLSIHGNLSGNTLPPDGMGSNPSTFGGGESVSRSLYGLSPSEINPLWGLAGHAGEEVDATSLSDYTSYFSRTPAIVNVTDSGQVSLAKQVELANMAWWWLNKGSIEFTSPNPIIHAGRLGDEERIWQVYNAAGGSNVIALNSGGSYAMFPFPGIAEGPDSDDNNNRNEGGADPSVPGSTPFRHPISFSGAGAFTHATNQDDVRLYRIPGTPVSVPQYDQFGLAGDVGYRTLLGGSVLTNSTFGLLGGSLASTFPANDMMEITLEDLKGYRWSALENNRGASQGTGNTGRTLLTVSDEPFEQDDVAVLQLSPADVVNSGVTSRLTDLLPSHVNPANNSRAVAIRQMFATQTWDRRQFGLPRMGAGPDGAPGTAGADDDGNGVVDDQSELGWPGTDDPRWWEFNTDIDSDGLAEFPPQFSPGGITAYTGYPGSPTLLPIVPQDPFRPEVRQLLHVERGNTDPNQFAFQFRLSINHILDSVRVNPASRPLAIEFRDLTPHPTSGVTNIPEIASGAALPAYPPTNATQQEWWARYDRQRMARDIFVTLYTLCRGNGQSTLQSNNFYPREELRQMAQFAVNVVDSVDRDDAHTVFEYDSNLFDGWGLDDQAWDTSGDLPAQRGQREVVYGVEEQQLAFNEALWVYQDQIADDLDATVFDESMQDHHFLYMELQNVSARPAELTAPSGSSSHISAAWRIRRKFAVRTPTPPSNTTPTAAERRQALGSVEAARTTLTVPIGEEALYFQNGAGRVNPGDMYSIGTGDKYAPGTTHVSTLYFDDDLDLTYEPIVPRAGPTITAPVAGTPPTLPTGANPALSLDMTYSAAGGGGSYNLVNAPGSVGGFLDVSNAPGAGSDAEKQLVLVLERRLNPNLTSLPIAENPWVAVDAMYVPRRDLALIATDTMAATLPSRLNNLRSYERAEPLAADSVALNGAAGRYRNTIHNNPIAGDGQNWYTTNSTVPAGHTSRVPYTNFHRHLNRDFTSSAELFSIPLRGPKTLTYALESMELSPLAQQTLSTIDAAEFDEDRDGDGNLDSGVDLNLDGTNDYDEDINGNGRLDTQEDKGVSPDFRLGGGETDENANGLLDSSYGPVSAGARFLRSSHPLGTAAPHYDNHWHRLLGFFEVPTRTHRQLSPDTLLLTRIPGMVNFNTMRHPEVFGGVIDDSSIATPPERDINSNGIRDDFEDFNENLALDRGLPDAAVGGRDHWFDLLQSRDGFDPVSYLVLPGTTSSNPFRSLSNVTTGQNSISSSLLRGHPRTTSNLLLFEAGTDAQSNGGLIDSRTRYRLLSKLMNNATTRSNVFFVYLSVQFHEAHQDPVTGAVRIGGRFDLDSDGDATNDGHRGFFVIDRSDVEQAFGTNGFQWEELVKYRIQIN